MSDPVELLARALLASHSTADTMEDLESHCADCREKAADYRAQARALLAELRPLIEAEEREACAQVADEFDGAFVPAAHWPSHIAAAIRERGKA